MIPSAIDILHAAINSNPEDFSPWHALADEYLAQGDETGNEFAQWIYRKQRRPHCDITKTWHWWPHKELEPRYATLPVILIPSQTRFIDNPFASEWPVYAAGHRTAVEAYQWLEKLFRGLTTKQRDTHLWYWKKPR